MKIIALVKNGYCLLGGEYFDSDFYFSLQESEYVYCSFFCADRLPVTARISVENGILLASAGLLITEISPSEAVIEAQCVRAFGGKNRLIAEERATSLGLKHTASLCLEDKLRLYCSCDKTSACFEVAELSKPSVFVRPTSFGALIVTNGLCESKKYLRLIAFSDNYESVFESVADDFEFTREGFTETLSFDDTLGRIRKRTYAFNGRAPVTVKTEFQYTEFKRYPPEKLPLLFIEALLADDTEKLTRYVTTSLAEKLPYVKEYLGEFLSISRAHSEGLTVALLYDSDGRRKIKKVSFELDNNRINNLSL